MKRIKAACITQTLHFQLKDGIEASDAKKMVAVEVEKYFSHLAKTMTKYQLISKREQHDGSIIVEIKKQYNSAPIGHYLD
jgi:hypothetical protein